MAVGLQIAGLFLAITATLAFTAWAEAWLASTAASVNGSHPTVKLSVDRTIVDLGSEEVVGVA